MNKKVLILIFSANFLSPENFLNGILCGSLTGATPGVAFLEACGISPYAEFRTEQFYPSAAISSAIARAGVLLWAAHSIYSEGPNYLNSGCFAGTALDYLTFRMSI